MELKLVVDNPLKEEDVDVILCFCTTPPIIVPKSDRAKKLMSLPEGIDGTIVLADAESVLRLFPENYIMADAEGYPKNIIIGEVMQLH